MKPWLTRIILFEITCPFIRKHCRQWTAATWTEYREKGKDERRERVHRRCFVVGKSFLSKCWGYFLSLCTHTSRMFVLFLKSSAFHVPISIQRSLVVSILLCWLAVLSHLSNLMWCILQFSPEFFKPESWIGLKKMALNQCKENSSKIQQLDIWLSVLVRKLHFVDGCCCCCC